MVSAMTIYTPGQICPVSGQYEIVWVSSKRRTGVERTVVRGEPFPPTPFSGQGYILVDRTKTR